MQKHFRLRKPNDFYTVRAKGQSWHSKSVVLLTWRRDTEIEEPSRFGFVVSKRIGKAVVRNKFKRKMRAAIMSQDISNGWDVVCIVKSGQPHLKVCKVSDSMVNLLQRANVIVGSD